MHFLLPGIRVVSIRLILCYDLTRYSNYLSKQENFSKVQKQSQGKLQCKASKKPKEMEAEKTPLKDIQTLLVMGYTGSL